MTAHGENSGLLGVTYFVSEPGEALVIDGPCTSSDSTLHSGQHFENCMQISVNAIDRDVVATVLLKQLAISGFCDCWYRF